MSKFILALLRAIPEINVWGVTGWKPIKFRWEGRGWQCISIWGEGEFKDNFDWEGCGAKEHTIFAVWISHFVINV